ncbi:hypothetical protein CHS0354_012687 [Potamilus streckersoni]|uniref:Glycine-rich protein n=1 Tax=Potamilus streckersoni TaxID=2493646 RepID=A0AAE0SY42_9BIVA|nr:hypothetical protein CHS0354_012687 [Potamilus streckersoni]
MHVIFCEFHFDGQTRRKAVLVLLACMVCAIANLPQSENSVLHGYVENSGGVPWGDSGGFGGFLGGAGGWGRFPYIKPRANVSISLEMYELRDKKQ